MSEKKSKKEVSRESLDKLVKHHMIAAFGAGLMPLPMVDFVAVSGVQLNLVRKVAAEFGMPFSKNAVTSIISALAGGAVPAIIAPSIAGLVKLVPVVGYPLGAVSMPAAAAAMTYAVGNVFIRHFESDGTLLSFDIDSAREYFREMFQKGKFIASDMEAEVSTTTAPKKSAPVKAAKKKPAAKKNTTAKKKPASKKKSTNAAEKKARTAANQKKTAKK
jgi:uncharacterized protein (DUF697 family)